VNRVTKGDRTYGKGGTASSFRGCVLLSERAYFQVLTERCRLIRNGADALLDGTRQRLVLKEGGS